MYFDFLVSYISTFLLSNLNTLVLFLHNRSQQIYALKRNAHFKHSLVFLGANTLFVAIIDSSFLNLDFEDAFILMLAFQFLPFKTVPLRAQRKITILLSHLSCRCLASFSALWST